MEDITVKSKKKASKLTDVIGILCGLLLVVIAVVTAISANAGKTAGLPDSQIPVSAKTFTGKAEGRNGEITVQVKADKDKIYQIKVLSDEETKGIGTLAIQNVPKAIYEQQSLSVDGVSGATVTSQAIGNAVYDALKQGEKDGIDVYHFQVIRVNKAAQAVPVPTTVKAISADEWLANNENWLENHPEVKPETYAEQYPEIYASFMANEENAEHPDYLEEYPQLKTLYAGYPFSYDYDEARGHTYVIDDVTATDRLHKMQADGTLAPEIFQKANCFTCKTPVMTAIVNETDGAAYSWTFEQMQNLVADVPLSCYTCHGDTPGEITITHTYLTASVGDNFNQIDGANLACGQCHNEYFFMPGTNSTTLPHNSLASMHPDQMLEYFNNDQSILKTEEDGSKVPFYDYKNKISGVMVIKVQHPELETFLGEGSVHRGKFTCADCHMSRNLEGQNGTTLANHKLTNPQDNEWLVENTCSKCHANLEAEITAIQSQVDARTREVADLIVSLHQKIGEAKANGATDEQLAEARSLTRDAQFYWDFVFVENSNGAHNSKLTFYCLDKAEELANAALSKLP